MTRRWAAARLGECRRGAVAPTVALSLFALIACGGIAFDYARLAALDTELQDAADQAALAAATQLDGQPGAIARATAAAQGLLSNSTLFANEAGGARGITIDTPVFYASYDNATDTYGAVATTDATAKVVRVAVVARQANYALTPVVGALNSGAMHAESVAALGVAVCKVPPLMICNPNENTDPTFSNNYAGKGMLLVARQNTADAYAPGNFGFLDTGYDTSGGTATLRKALGQQTFLADCVAGDKVTTEPGASSPALDAVNTRFDIFTSNTQQNTVCGNGQCPPSANVRKDLMRDAPSGSPQTGTIKKFCKPVNDPNPDKDNNGNAHGWQMTPSAGRYLPASNAALSSTERAALNPMGHPRDICHAYNPASGCTGGRVGNGTWDRAAYFQSNYGASFAWATTAGLGSTVTRYQTYLWELTNHTTDSPAGLKKPFDVKSSVPPKNSLGTLTAEPVCQVPGITPVGDIDRRRLTVAVVNCNGTPKVQGKTSNITVQKWIDIFLVEPSWNRDRTTANDLYVEIIGEAKITGVGGEQFQVERSVPYLVR